MTRLGLKLQWWSYFKLIAESRSEKFWKSVSIWWHYRQSIVAAVIWLAVASILRRCATWQMSLCVLCGVEVVDDVSLLVQCIRVLQLLHKIGAVNAFIQLLVHRRYVLRRLILTLEMWVGGSLLQLSKQSSGWHRYTGAHHWAWWRTSTWWEIDLTIWHSIIKRMSVTDAS